LPNDSQPFLTAAATVLHELCNLAPREVKSGPGVGEPRDLRFVAFPLVLFAQ